MSLASSSIDTGSRRWLAALAVAVAATVVYMTWSFLKPSSPTEPSLVAQKPDPAPTAAPVTRAEPDWNTAPAAPVAQAATTRPDPFAAQYAADAWSAAAHDPIAHEKAVQHQAEYLRDKIAQGKLPSGFGNLTKEKVDDMEKKGVLIE